VLQTFVVFYFFQDEQFYKIFYFQKNYDSFLFSLWLCVVVDGILQLITILFKTVFTILFFFVMDIGIVYDTFEKMAILYRKLVLYSIWFSYFFLYPLGMKIALITLYSFYKIVSIHFGVKKIAHNFYFLFKFKVFYF
jgi:hypothetical protein